MPDLPRELIDKILFGYGGLCHPVAMLVTEYWEQMDFEYWCWDAVETQCSMVLSYNEDHSEISCTKTYTNFLHRLDCPRLFFPAPDAQTENLVHQMSFSSNDSDSSDESDASFDT